MDTDAHSIITEWIVKEKGERTYWSTCKGIYQECFLCHIDNTPTFKHSCSDCAVCKNEYPKDKIPENIKALCALETL